jgi:hypothetical protein
MPGAYPVVFNTGVARALVERHFELAPNLFVTNYSDIFDRVSQSPIFLRVMARVAPTLAEQAVWRDGFRREFLASSVMATAQALARAHQTITGNIGDTSAVYGPELETSQLVRQLAAEFGEFDLPDLGRRYLFKDYMSVIKRVMRVAYNLESFGELNNAATSYYFPTSADDHSVDDTLKVGALAILARRTDYPLSIPNFQGPFDGGTPALIELVHATVPYPVDDWAALEFYFGNRPATHVGYNVPGFWSLIQAATGLVIEPLPAAQPIVDFIGNDFKEWASTISDRWGRYLPVVSQIFKLSSSRSHLGKAGSSAQTFVVMGESWMPVVNGLASVSPRDISLSAIYPVTWLWDSANGLASQMPKDVAFSADVQLGQVRGRWIESGLVQEAP